MPGREVSEPGIPFSRRSLVGAGLLALCPPLLAPAAGQENQGEEDPHYDRVLKAYRKQLSPEESAALEEEEPGPTLYGNTRTPGEHDLTRLFASLPDPAHARLRREGYLKWRADALPRAQQELLREMVRTLEGRGAGPFPLQGARVSAVGFARIVIAEIPGRVYAWWIAAPGKEEDPAWLTLVRVYGLGTQEQADAHRAQLPRWARQPDSPTIPPGEWRPIPAPTVPPVEEDPRALEDAHIRNLLLAFRGDLKRDARRALLEADPLLAARLEMREPAEQGLNRFVARLSDRESRSLTTERRLVWRTEQLERERRKLLEPLVARLNRSRNLSGQGEGGFSMEPYSGTRLGLELVSLPDQELPVLTWWIRSPSVAGPTWISLSNQKAVKSPHYYRVHLERLGG